MEALPIAPLDENVIRSPSHWTRMAWRVVIWILIAGILVISFREGLKLRRWVFETTDPIRFVDDIQRGCYWGLVASGPEGYLNQYDKMQDEVPDRLDARWVPWLDYAPLRLMVMREWGAWQRVYFPPAANAPLLQAWQHSYAFNAPVLWFNTGMEIFGSFCAFWLTRHWVVRSNGGVPRHHFDGIWQGIAAALILWFSPDVLLSAHAWITWDFWIIPWYLCTALLASLDWWFAAGIAMAIGAMFKGQQLTVAPIFILWPLLQGRFGAALRWVVGLTFGIAFIASGWLLTYLPPGAIAHARELQSLMDVASYPTDLFAVHRVFDFAAATWIFEIVLMAAVGPWLLRMLGAMDRPTNPSRLQEVLYSQWTLASAVVIVVIGVSSWPMLFRANHPYWYVGVLGGGILAAASMGMRPRNQPYVLAGALGCSLLLCMVLFHGGTGWAKCTFEYGTVHWPYMTQGPADNIPGLFEIRFGWPREAQETAFTLPAFGGHWPGFVTRRSWWPAFDVDISAKTFFDSIYVFFLLISGIAIGLQARRNDRRMLVALMTPWIMFFLWPVQIHERYLLFAAGVGVCCIGNSVGTCLLGLLVTLCSTVMHVDVLMDHTPGGVDAFGQNLSKTLPWLFSPECGDTIRTYVSATHPDLAWGILILGLAFIYLSLTPSAPWRRGTKEIAC